MEDAALDSFHSQIKNQAAYIAGDSKMKLTAHDIYKELRLRGYDYGKTFQGILESNNAGVCLFFIYQPNTLVFYIVFADWLPSCDWPSPGDSGKLQWSGNWVTFLDTMLQMMVVGLSGRSLRLPTRIRSVCIDPSLHLEKVCDDAEGKQGVVSL